MMTSHQLKQLEKLLKRYEVDLLDQNELSALPVVGRVLRWVQADLKCSEEN